MDHGTTGVSGFRHPSHAIECPKPAHRFRLSRPPCPIEPGQRRHNAVALEPKLRLRIETEREVVSPGARQALNADGLPNPGGRRHAGLPPQAGTRRYLPAPWHVLYFLPEPQGQGSLRPTSGTDESGWPRRPSELDTAAGAGGAATCGAPPMKKSSAPPVGGGGGGGGAIRRDAGSAVTWILRNRSVNVDW